MTTTRSKLQLANWILVFALCLLAVGLAPNAHSDDNQSPTDPFYTFEEWAGPPIRVWFHLPTQFTPDSPIVFVMHGVGRDADRYYAEWRDYAEQYQFALLVPEFSQRDFPKAAGYNLGNVFDTEGHVNPDTLWSFSALDPIFEAFASRVGSNRDAYRLYGHSAGAQFVHRFLFYKPNAKTEMIISANAGWYTLPKNSVEFPYGLKGSGINEATLSPALQKNVIVLLGDEDTDPNHRSLRRTPEALAQGAHRFERGHTFYSTAKNLAAKANNPFTWQRVIVPGAEHSNAQMAAAAAPLLAQMTLSPERD